jgi:hypothetical protein
MDQTAERLYDDREKRVMDAIELRRPDRVPINVRFHFFPAAYMIQNPYERFLGPLLDALDCKQARWPGRNLPSHLPYQYVEQEYMKAEEYDHFLSDPSDFIVRRLWPRIFGSLKGFEKLRSLHGVVSYSVGAQTAFSSPEVLEALDGLRKVSEESIRIASYSKMFKERSRKEGFPMEAEAASQAPFDFLADFFRGSKGIMIDMYRRPEVLIRACEKVLPFLLERALLPARTSGNPRVFIPLHQGTDSFMSREQYLKFYWPTLKELMLALISEGLYPCPFFEGEYMSRLDIIKDIPSGKTCYKFETVDMVKAREVLGEGIAIRGGVPISLLVTGTPGRVREHVRGLIDTVAKRGAFIMDAGTGLDDAKPENVRALFETTGEYGRY